MIDTHGHFADSGVDEMFNVVLNDVSRVSEVQAKLREKAATLKPGEWLVGAGWDEGKLAEHRYFLASDLDKVTPNNPVWLMHTTGHYGVANSYALKLAHVTAATPDPPAGTIDRDAQGRPTGVLKESAMGLMVNLTPPTTPEQWQRGILHSIEGLHREGMTGMKDPAITEPVWDAYRELLRQNKLDEHVFVLWDSGHTLESARQTLARISMLPKPPGSSALPVRQAMASCFPAAPKSSWTAAAERAPLGCTSPGTKTALKLTERMSAIQPPSRKFIARWSACSTRPAFTSARTLSETAPLIGWWIPTPRF